MKTYLRKCLKTKEFQEEGNTAKIEKDKYYITSESMDGLLTVFTNYWIGGVDEKLFDTGEIYTK